MNEIDGFNAVERYDKLELLCDGLCEGTGLIPISADTRKGIRSSATVWLDAEKVMHSENGWHFVTCPECGGTGYKQAER